MRARLRFWIDESAQRWMRMTLLGDGWPADWAVPYSYLDSWGMLSWFHTPPPEAEGLQAGVDYRMSDTPSPHEFAEFLNNLHQLIGQIRPLPDPHSGLTIEDEREYE